MLEIEQFRKIQEYKKLGMTKKKTSEMLDLSRRAVYDWWDKTEAEYLLAQSKNELVLDNYRHFVIDILKVCPQVHNTVLKRRIIEEFGSLDVPDSTFYRYIKRLREQTGLLKPTRKYALRSETDPGHEAQVDFGQYVMKSMYGNNVRVYFFCMTLSYSRMKFAYFALEPFTVKEVIKAHNFAFKYFGGRPQMIVYDQDRTMVVSENFGDVIFTEAFEDYIRDTGYSVYLCHGYDPESKGKIEKTVDFIKHLFLDGRIYYGIDRLNAECLMWLDKIGNNIINDTTKKIPKELYKNEFPLLEKFHEKKETDIVVVTVINSTIKYLGIRYGLPKDKVFHGESLRVERFEDELLIFKGTTGEIVCKHKYSPDAIGVVPCSETPIKEVTAEDELKEIFKNYPSALEFLKLMRKQKPRYVYQQCRRLSKMRRFYSDERLLEGMTFCLEENLCTVFELCSFLVYKYGEETASKFNTKEVFRHYKDRAKEIREALGNG